MSSMSQHGYWWKGTTDSGIEVSVSNGFFRDIQTRQLASRQVHPVLTQAVIDHYGGHGHQSPQWWLDSFPDRPGFGVGPGPHKWIHRPGYDKVMLGRVVSKGFRNNQVGTEGTIIFRKV